MIRGTTPLVTLKLPMKIDFDTLYITFKQGDTVLEKTLDDVEIDGLDIVVPLTQTETLAFDSDSPVRVQLRGKVGSIAYASKIMLLAVSDILKGGEI